jgi:peptidoglycan/xylan/chitin deacetylase (PgdA/CDA1 family)
MLLPILMYHKVGAPVAAKADTFLNVSERSFKRQMRLLKRLGYTGVTFAEGLEWLRGERRGIRKPVCVTFDDGYANVADFAAPTLKEFDWPATVFVPTAYVGGENTWDEANGYPLLPIMDWGRLRELQSAGWEMAGHTRTHPRLGETDDAAALTDIRSGMQDLESNLEARPRTFCYPFGSMNDRTPVLAREAGFAGACTTKSGLASSATDPYLLPRVKIAYRDDVWGFFYRLAIRPHLG